MPVGRVGGMGVGMGRVEPYIERSEASLASIFPIAVLNLKMHSWLVPHYVGKERLNGVSPGHDTSMQSGEFRKNYEISRANCTATIIRAF